MARYRVWLTTKQGETHVTDVQTPGDLTHVVLAAVAQLEFNPQDIAKAQAELLTEPPERVIEDSDDREQRLVQEWLTAHGEQLVHAINLQDPSLVCWFEEFQNNIVIQVSANEEAWFGIDGAASGWRADILDHSVGGYTGSFEAVGTAKSRVIWEVARSLVTAVKRHQGRR